jgi:hypothetical protein
MMMSYALAGDDRAAWTDDGMTAPAARRDVFLRKSRRFTYTLLALARTLAAGMG